MTEVGSRTQNRMKFVTDSFILINVVVLVGVASQLWGDDVVGRHTGTIDTLYVGY